MIQPLVHGQKEKFEKHLLLLNIHEVFLEFKKVNPDVQTGFSKFCELRPKCVANVNSSGICTKFVFVSTIKMLIFK